VYNLHLDISPPSPVSGIPTTSKSREVFQLALFFDRTLDSWQSLAWLSNMIRSLQLEESPALLDTSPQMRSLVQD
jgi:hypothetical protein